MALLHKGKEDPGSSSSGSPPHPEFCPGLPGRCSLIPGAPLPPPLTSLSEASSFSCLGSISGWRRRWWCSKSSCPSLLPKCPPWSPAHPWGSLEVQEGGRVSLGPDPPLLVLGSPPADLRRAPELLQMFPNWLQCPFSSHQRCVRQSPTAVCPLRRKACWLAISRSGRLGR